MLVMKSRACPGRRAPRADPNQVLEVPASPLSWEGVPFTKKDFALEPRTSFLALVLFGGSLAGQPV